MDDLQQQMMKVMNLNSHETELLEASQLDYFVSAFWWAKEQGFTTPQVSAFFTAAHTLLMNVKGKVCILNPPLRCYQLDGNHSGNSVVEKHMHILDNLNEMKEMFSGIGQPDYEAPGGLDCFDVSQARTISKYFHQV